MSPSARLIFAPLAAAIAACAPVANTEEELVPIYESPCSVFDAGDGACGTPDENGSYIDAWSSLSCMDVCAALDTTASCELSQSSP